MFIKTPENAQEWDAYFDLRWRILRAQWNQPKGTEKDETEHEVNTFHAMAVNDSGDICGVARLHLISENNAQLRYMAVNEAFQGKGVGKALIKFLENQAVTMGIGTIILQARENAVNFYLSQGYSVVEKTFLLYDSIQHYMMQKNLR
jgi:N-acetylglutamate synthase-like GNAT family acetyltransferase